MVRDQDLVSIQEARDGIATLRLRKMYASFTQEVDRIVEAIAQAAYKQAENLAVLAVTETKMGIIEHKK